MIGVDADDIVPSYAGSFEHAPYIIKRLDVLFAQLVRVLERIGPAPLASSLDTVSDLHRLGVVVIVALLLTISGRDDEFRTVHDVSFLRRLLRGHSLIMSVQ